MSRQVLAQPVAVPAFGRAIESPDGTKDQPSDSSGWALTKSQASASLLASNTVCPDWSRIGIIANSNQRDLCIHVGHTLDLDAPAVSSPEEWLQAEEDVLATGGEDEGAAVFGTNDRSAVDLECAEDVLDDSVGRAAHDVARIASQSIGAGGALWRLNWRGRSSPANWRFTISCRSRSSCMRFDSIVPKNSSRVMK